MSEQTTKSYPLPVDDPATLVASLKELLEWAFARIQRLETMATDVPTAVYSAMEALEASPELAPYRDRVSTGFMLKVIQATYTPLINEYLATGVFPPMDEIKPKLVLAAIDGVRVDGASDTEVPDG